MGNIITGRRQMAVSFAYTAELDKVVLIRKNRPVWQAGRLNGIGGKLERGESLKQCAVRKFWEETGIAIGEDCISSVGHMVGRGWYVEVYTMAGEAYEHVRTITDEQVEIWDVFDKRLADPTNCISNIYTLVHYCRHFIESGSDTVLSLQYP